MFESENARFSNEQARPLSGAALGGAEFFDSAAAVQGGDFLVPAQLVSPPIATMGGGGRKKDKKHAHTPNKAFMDDYFQEGEKKSKELDYAPSAKSTPPPPPPKAGGSPPLPKAGGPAKAMETKSENDSGVE